MKALRWFIGITTVMSSIIALVFSMVYIIECQSHPVHDSLAILEILFITGIIGIYAAFYIFVVGRRSYWLKHKELDELIEKEIEKIQKYSEVIETYDGLDEKFDEQRATLVQIYEYAKKYQLDDLLEILHNGLI